MKYRAICCDADGTLLTTDKKITDENRYWIQRVVKEKNVKFVIVSGRMLTGIRKFYSELGITGAASCCNGTCLFDENDNLIQDYRVDGKYLPVIVDCAHEHKLDLLYIVGNDWYMESRDNWTYNIKLKFYFKDCIIADMHNLITEKCPNKMVVMSQDKSILNGFKEDLISRGLTGDKIFYYEGKDFLEMMPFCADKSLAVETLSKAYDIPIEQIIAIGDDFNDIKMLKTAGLGVAMANACPEVKAVSDCQTLSNDENGVAAIIKKLFF